MSQQAMANPNRAMDPTPEPPVARAYTRLSSSVSDLDAEVKALIDQLRPALNPDFPETDGDDESKPAPMSELASVLFSEISRIREITQALNTIRHRLEI